MKKVFYLLLTVAFVLTTGCASILKGTSQTVTFESTPDDARVIIDGKTMGETPMSISLKKRKVTSVTFKKDGYEMQTIPVEQKFDGVAILNVFWDLSTTDVLSGAVMEYRPDHYHVELKKKDMDMEQHEQMQEKPEEQMEPQQMEEQQEPQEKPEAG